MPLISIIIVTYNSVKHIERCLGSVLAQQFKAYEVIIIDNASKDDTVSFIKARYPGISLIENRVNHGPASARNLGITKSKGNFILCLDHDTTLTPDFLDNMYKVIVNNDKIGAVQPKILMFDAKSIYSKGIYNSFLRRFYDIGSSSKDINKLDNQIEIFGVSAAAALYRKEALESIRYGQEYFDEDFFYFFEDVDMSWRLRKKGWRIVYTPLAVCSHIGGRSRNKDKISQYLCFRNRYLLIIKNETFTGFLKLVFVFFVYDIWRGAYMLIVNPDYFLKACYEIVRLAPNMVRKRCGINPS